MAVKGNEPSNWNWQLHDKQEGYFPTNEEDKFDGAFTNDRGIDDFLLDKQLAKVEEDLKKEVRTSNNAIQRAISGNIQPEVINNQTNKVAQEKNLLRRTTRGGN